MDIEIDCAHATLSPCGSNEVTATLDSIDETQFKVIISEIEPDVLVEAFGDDATLIAEIPYSTIVESVDNDYLLTEIGEEKAKAWFGLVEEKESTLDDFTTNQALHYFGTESLLDNISIEDVIAHYGEDAFKQLIRPSSKIDLG